MFTVHCKTQRSHAVIPLTLFTAALSATEPQIYDIERLSPTVVALHFNSDANRTYIVEYTDSLTNPDWKELYHANPLPFPDHFVITDSLTNTFRAYRLSASP